MRPRAPAPNDVQGVLAVLVARDLADLGVAQFTLADLEHDWRGSKLDLAASTLVVEDGGRIVAYAAVRRPGTLAAVAPDQEGRGIGAGLLRWAEQRERELGRERHRQWVAARNTRAQALLRAGGMRRHAATGA